MKSFNKYSLGFILMIGVSQSVIAQLAPENIWVSFNSISDVPAMVDGHLQSSNEEIQKLIGEYNFSSVERAVPNSRQEILQKVYNIECLCDAEELASRINHESTALNRAELAPKYEFMNDPNDYNSIYAQDYALDLINAKGAWDYSTGDSNVILGISDGNFFTNHEELQTEYVSINTAANTPSYYYYHGTAVAATAAGATDNSQGKSAIGYDCKLSLASMGYNRALQMSYEGVEVINLSWASGCYYSTYVQSIIDEIYNNGTIIVAAAGNGGTCGGSSNLVYPAAHNHVIAVSSVGPQDNHERVIGNPASTHQHNSSVDICAPGYDVALTVAPGWYMTGNGTSFAAPYVTGTIGLMLSVNPCLTFEDVEQILSMTAVNIDAQNPNYIGQLGAGRMDAMEAVKLAAEYSCGGDDGNNGHGNDIGNYDPSNPGNGDTGVTSNPNRPGNDDPVLNEEE